MGESAPGKALNAFGRGMVQQKYSNGAGMHKKPAGHEELANG